MDVFNKPLYEDIMNTGIMLSVLALGALNLEAPLLLTFARFSDLEVIKTPTKNNSLST